MLHHQSIGRLFSHSRIVQSICAHPTMAIFSASFQSCSSHVPELSTKVTLPRTGEMATTALPRCAFSSTPVGSNATRSSSCKVTVQLLTMSFISMPASMSASVAALIRALATLPSFSSTVQLMSRTSFGNFSSSTTLENADCIVRAMAASSAVFLGPTLDLAGKVTKLTSTWMRPVGVNASLCAASLSRGPNTPTMAFVLPSSTYADPCALDRTPSCRWGGRMSDGVFRPSGRVRVDAIDACGSKRPVSICMGARE
mmetsp:Transcript_11051/g.30857  ORF Transcript_11051/g.30857 Transcript_11051/m.30857 type:complete len:256 (+) Transcript_11051:823-1590(+)